MNIQSRVKYTFIINSNQMSDMIYKATLLMDEHCFTVGQCQLFKDEDRYEPCMHMGTKTNKGQVNLWMWVDKDYIAYCEITCEENPDYALELYKRLNPYNY